MATESKMVMVISLNGSNYPTWKVQCRMVLIKDGLWNIVSSSERLPNAAEADKYAKSILSKVAYRSPMGPKDPNQDYLLCIMSGGS